MTQKGFNFTDYICTAHTSQKLLIGSEFLIDTILYKISMDAAVK